jgi:alpha,alpha-trehalase
MILGKTGLSNEFDVRIDGIEAERLELSSKPDPYILWEVARRLGIEPEQTIVIEDSVVGVTASSRGRFGLTIGIDDGEQQQLMLEHGADYVLRDLCRLHVDGTSGDDEFSPPFLAEMELISNQLADKQPALFLDYGGTLTPAKQNPEIAELSKKMRHALRQVAKLMPLTIVSGRDVEDLRNRVGLPELIYAGSHGLEILGHDLHLELPEGIDVLEDLDEAMAELSRLLGEFPDVSIERKRFAIVLRYKERDMLSTAHLEATIEQVKMQLPRLRKIGGKQVFELLPNIDWNKGRAVKWLLAEMGLEGPDKLPLYIGDDVTDEDAFRSLRGVGIGILVAKRPQPSMATYRISDSNDVLKLLHHLIQALKHKG